MESTRCRHIIMVLYFRCNGEKKSGAVARVIVIKETREIGKANQNRASECRKWGALDLPLYPSTSLSQ